MSYITDAEILGGVNYGNDEFTYVRDEWDTDRLSEYVPRPSPLKIDYRDPHPVYIERDREPSSDGIKYSDREVPVQTISRMTKKEPMTGSRNTNKLPLSFDSTQTIWILLFFIIILVCMQMYNLNKIHKIVKSFTKQMAAIK